MAGESGAGLKHSMATLDRRYRQRIIGAVVLVVLAATFLPMLFTRSEGGRDLRVEAPPRPSMPHMRPLQDPEIAVPLPQAPPVLEAPSVEVDLALADEHLDGDGLPITWAVLVARLRELDAEPLRAALAAQGLEAYVRNEGEWFAVYIGPFLDLESAEQQLESIARDGEHSPLLVRYQPQTH